MQATTEKKVSNIEVMALFKDKAMVNINDKQYLLKVDGEEILGVKLIKATSKYALLEIEGSQKKYILGNRVQASYSKVEKKTVHIYRDGNGMFKTTGSINGYTVDFLVDTGASVIALNSAMAKRLGLQYKLKGEQTVVVTASGKEHAYSISLDQVKVGEIMLRNIRGVVIEGNDPDTPLLGMSFLGRLNIKNEGQQMSLEEKF
ncbi:MAG: TIGR02281 family clan AA aspartic protease [Pseudomonadota bacterium]